MSSHQPGQEPGLYRGGSDPVFGLWRLREDGAWLFSVPLEKERWRFASADEDGKRLRPLVDSKSKPNPPKLSQKDLEVISFEIVNHIKSVLDSDSSEQAIYYLDGYVRHRLNRVIDASTKGHES